MRRAPSIRAPTGSGTAAPVYADFGFDDFKSEENLPPLEKRGPLASDAAMTDEIIREADATDDPVFFFAVSLQNHGPYEPYRYYNPTHKVQAPISQWAREFAARATPRARPMPTAASSG